jgi:hypothetical protein
MSEILNDSASETRRAMLLDRQSQFAALLGVDQKQLEHLKFCTSCSGCNPTWTDWSMDDLPVDLVSNSEDGIVYRSYLAEVCSDCDASGFEGGNFGLTVEEWLQLGRSSLFSE